MRCPFCQYIETKVLDTRVLQRGHSTRRRRECIQCDKRFTTYETIEISLPLVYKKDGRREEYSRSKLLGGIEKACQKLPISAHQIQALIDQVEKNLMELGVKEIPTTEIGQMVMPLLKKINSVAYVRFASVYMKFQNVDEFYRDLQC